MRLIDADALKELKFPNGESEYATGWNDAISAIMTFQPTIDAVPVIRCDDCKFYSTCLIRLSLPVTREYCGNAQREESEK